MTWLTFIDRNAMLHHPTYGCATRGSTVVELLTALLVVSIGILGIAAVYMERSRTSPAHDLREEADRLATVMAELIRSSPHGGVGYDNVIGVVCEPDRAPQDAEDAAAQATVCWQDEVESTLPNGAGSVIRDALAPELAYIVTVSWSAPGKGAASYVVRIRPARGPARDTDPLLTERLSAGR